MRLIDADAYAKYINKKMKEILTDTPFPINPSGVIIATAIARAIEEDMKDESITPTIDVVMFPDLEEKEPSDDAIEFQRRADLMERYCQGVGDDSDPNPCYSCIWSYYPEDRRQPLRCQFEGLTADEMEKLIKDWRDRISNGSE